MSLFNPDAAALPNASSIAFLAQRDVSLSIPVNFCTYPGVAITAACFANGVYEGNAATRCISNLLAMGFRRLDVDIYWDASRQFWSLCPVELSAPGIAVTTSQSVPSSQVATATSLAKTSLIVRDTPAIGAAVPWALRQADGSSTTTVVTSPTTTSSITSSSSPVPISTNGTVVSIGPYTCSPAFDLYRFVDIVSDYLKNTETNLNATTLIISANIHAASPIDDPTGGAQTPIADRLPKSNALLGSVIMSNASLYLYTPAELAYERSNLNETNNWLWVAEQYQPNTAFFEINNNNGVFSTPDGWPSESYLAFTKGKRLFVEYGSVDPQMIHYDFSGDAATIFPQGYLTSARNVTVSSTGAVTGGCIYDPTAYSLSSANSSWAVTTLGTGVETPATALQQVLAEAGNLTACGISPFLNSTLNNATADRDFAPYLQFVQQTIWSWAPGEPLNSTTNASTTTYNCAALNATSGHWQATNCFKSHLGACRNGTAPYTWSISAADGSYQDVSDHCPANTSFDVPRTALENTYLAAAWRVYSAQRLLDGGDDDDDDDDDDGKDMASDGLLWLNLNDIDVNGCWVIGQNASCPYPGPNTGRTRRVVVPVVAGVIVFLLAALTVLVKCAGNHQSSKRRRRRGNDGFDYEGVPS